jgi:prevent-host-death family protein
MAKLANLAIFREDGMVIKSISSTQAKNNFGQVLDDVTHNDARYVIKRHDVPQAIVLSFDDFAYVLNDEDERHQMDTILKEIRPEYRLGQVITVSIADSE